jgi:hypothetical protein
VATPSELPRTALTILDREVGVGDAAHQRGHVARLAAEFGDDAAHHQQRHRHAQQQGGDGGADHQRAGLLVAPGGRLELGGRGFLLEVHVGIDGGLPGLRGRCGCLQQQRQRVGILVEPGQLDHLVVQRQRGGRGGVDGGAVLAPRGVGAEVLQLAARVCVGLARGGDLAAFLGAQLLVAQQCDGAHHARGDVHRLGHLLAQGHLHVVVVDDEVEVAAQLLHLHQREAVGERRDEHHEAEGQLQARRQTQAEEKLDHGRQEVWVKREPGGTAAAGYAGCVL